MQMARACNPQLCLFLGLHGLQKSLNFREGWGGGGVLEKSLIFYFKFDCSGIDIKLLGIDSSITTLNVINLGAKAANKEILRSKVILVCT